MSTRTRTRTCNTAQPTGPHTPLLGGQMNLPNDCLADLIVTTDDADRHNTQHTAGQNAPQSQRKPTKYPDFLLLQAHSTSPVSPSSTGTACLYLSSPPSSTACPTLIVCVRAPCASYLLNRFLENWKIGEKSKKCSKPLFFGQILKKSLISENQIFSKRRS